MKSEPLSTDLPVRPKLADQPIVFRPEEDVDEWLRDHAARLEVPLAEVLRAVLRRAKEAA